MPDVTFTTIRNYITLKPQTRTGLRSSPSGTPITGAVIPDGTGLSEDLAEIPVHGKSLLCFYYTMAGRLQQEKMEVLQKRRPVQPPQGVLRKAAPEAAENKARRAEEVRAEGRSRSAGGPSWPAEGHEGDAPLEEARHGLRHQREPLLVCGIAANSGITGTIAASDGF